MGIAEELREKARSLRRSNDFVCNDFVAIEFGISSPCKSPRRCCDCYADMFERIADRIDAERALPEGIDAERALPEGVEWPRFEDGEPVKVGDEVGSDEPFTAKEIAFESERWLIKASSRSAFGCFHGAFGERVERPAPKVLDADGVPIKVGDVVYYDGEPHPLTVVGITRDGKDALVDANGEESCVEGGRPQDFSHDAPKPVLDADGVPIKVGDTVYFVGGNGRALTVERIDANGGEPAVDLVYTGERIHWHSANPEKLTHERPDSWRLWGDDLDMAVKVGEVDKVEMMRRAKALAKADSEARGVE